MTWGRKVFHLRVSLMGRALSLGAGGNRTRQVPLVLGTKHIYSFKEANDLKTFRAGSTCIAPRAHGQPLLPSGNVFRLRTEVAKFFRKIIIIPAFTKLSFLSQMHAQDKYWYFL